MPSEFDSMFAGHFHEFKSLKIVVDTPFHHVKEICDKLPNLEELYIKHKKRRKSCFSGVADQASLNSTKLKVVKIYAKSMQFAAGVLSTIDQSNTLNEFTHEYNALYPHDEFFHANMTQNLSDLLNS